MAEPQNFKNHTRFHPPFHFFLIPLLLICFIAAILHAWKQPNPPNILLVPLSFGALFTAFLARIYSLKVQDRVIRLEESIRLRSFGLAPDSLSVRQLVALRFASDAELPALAQRAAAENLDPKAIKAAITNWRADHDRV